MFNLLADQAEVKCHHTPCHTQGHILYECRAKDQSKDLIIEWVNGYQVTRGVDKFVFTGDTIFVGGCGRFFEGDAKGMVHAMQVAL